MNSLLKKLYVDWGFKRGLTPEKRMNIIRWMHRDNPNVSIGELSHFEEFQNLIVAEPSAGISIGDGVTIHGNSRFSAWGPGRISIGNRCIFGSGGRITCRDNITIGDYCLVSWDVAICDFEAHPTQPKERIGQMDYMMAQFNPLIPWEKTGLTPEQKAHFDTYWDNPDNYPHAPITIGRNVWIGQDVTILRGSTIGDNCIIGAKSVVLGSMPANSIVMGRPARPIAKDIDEGEREEYWRNEVISMPSSAEATKDMQ